ncbi:unnamed protein product, partial [Polarella glacialis]
VQEAELDTGAALGSLSARLADLNELATRGDVPGALAVFDEILPSKDQLGIPDTMLYNTVLKAMSNSGDAVAATEWHERMRREGIRLNSKHFGKLIEAAAQAADVERAQYWFDESQ